MSYTRVMTLAAMMTALSACTIFHPPNAYMPSRSGIEAGETITVQGNENIYAIAHQHNISMRDLIVLNDLKPPYDVKPGQSLTLPVGGSTFNGNAPVPAAAPRDEVERLNLSPIEPAAVSTQPLDPVAAPAAPAPASTAPTSLTPAPLSTAPAPAVQPGPQSSLSTDQVRFLNQPAAQKQVATTAPAAAPSPATVVAAPAATAASTAVAASAVQMVWPVQGPILSTFGSKGPGLSNDGVNIGAPKGSPVVAAAPGTVVYAGNEMKGFGNLVLIRHQGEWVTAYAHLDRVLVKKDSIVAQGDEIGTVGRTGNVTSPQLHFEIRQAGKAVDPSEVIKSNS